MSSLDQRLHELSQALENADVTASAVAEYVFEKSHQVNLSKAFVIDYHSDT